MRNETLKISSGFTLMELIVAIIILSTLAAIAIPSYVHYAQKAYYIEIVQAADRYRLAVDACLRKNNGHKENCDSGKNGIPPNVMPGMGIGQVNSVVVNNAVITVTPKTENGILKSDTYVLTPHVEGVKISWVASGGGCEKNLAPTC